MSEPIYIAPPAEVEADLDLEADLDALCAARVIFTDAPLNPLRALLADALRIPVRPLSDLVGGNC